MVNNDRHKNKPIDELAHVLLSFKQPIKLQQYRLFTIFTWG